MRQERDIGARMFLLGACIVAIAVVAGCTTRGADEGKTAVSYTRWGDPAELESTRELIAEFMRENPDIVVRVDVVSWRQYWQKMQTATVTGTAQDVWLVAPAHFEQYVAAGHVLDLTPYLERDGIRYEDYFDGCFEEFCFAGEGTELLNVPLDKGRMYAFPRDYNCNILYYNRDHFDAAGVPYPTEDWTWADMVAAAEKLTIDFDGDGFIDQWGMSLPSYVALPRINGTQLVDAANRKSQWSPHDGDSRVLDAIRFDRDCIYKYKVVPPPTIQLEGDTFITGKTSIIIEGVWEARNFNRSKYLWDIASIPTDVKGRPRGREANGTGHCIYSKTKVAEAAWKLVKFLSSEKSQRALARSGTSVPSLKSAAFSDDFLAPFDRPSKDKYHIIFDNLAQGEFVPHFTRGYLEYENYARQMLQSVWLGTRTPEEAVKLIDEETDRVLAEQYGKESQ